MLIYNFSKFSL